MSDPPEPQGREDGDEQLLQDLLREVHLTAPYQLPAVFNRCAEALGMRTAIIYLADLQQRLLIPLDHGDEPLPVDSGDAGWAYRTISLRVHECEDGLIVWVPLVDGAERLGVLGVHADAVDGARLRRCRILAAVLAMVVTSKRAYSDWFVGHTRTAKMALSAEMLRAFLPPRTIGRTGVISTAVLEPAYQVSGDAFDHSLTKNILHASIFDAMGHDLAAGLTTSVVMAGCRNARRSGAGLLSMVEAVDEALAHWVPDHFCTGLLCRLDVDTGILQWCNCGHPPPLLIRGGQVLDRALERAPEPPMGLPFLLGTSTREMHETVLVPGDRVLLYTDGITEARSAAGEEYGLDRFTDFIIRSTAADEAPAETLRLLVHAFLDHQRNRLNDDATMLLVEWCPESR
ncbi:PP2C family protein-serine/threonine phosphatase [Streptomyces orinoci]|uniref:PP2C family protein-serine/threonine phosphatase n=1 Tax=Streptomyces orinoci TaxID=67339 RepID=A0ABV3K793_STRON|nr:PP2C family protein-serine/threonine phosphatase [Streptomyces orinoci]